MTTKVSDAARLLGSKRKTFGGGRPKKLAPCPKCKLMLGVAELRKHKCS